MKQRWLGRLSRSVTVATRHVFETLTSSFRPWNYRGVMGLSRSYRQAWADVTSYDGLIEGIDEQLWWRSRMLKAAAVSSFELMRASRRINTHYAAGICVAVALILGFCVTLLATSRNATGNLTASIFLALTVAMAISVVAVHTLHYWKTASLPYLLAAVAIYVLAAGYAESADTALPATLWKFTDLNSMPIATLCICTVLLSIGGAVAALTDLVGLMIYIQFFRKTANLYFPCVLMHVAAQLENDPECRHQGLTAERARLINLVYFVNSRIELILRGSFKVIDPLVRTVLRSRLSNASLYLQSVALRIAITANQDDSQIIRNLRRTAVCLLFQLYDHLPTSPSDDDANLTAGQRNRTWSYWLRWAVITLLPVAAITTVRLLHIDLPEIVVQWLTAFAIAWVLVRAIAAMEPNYRATMAAAREILGDTPNLGGK